MKTVELTDEDIVDLRVFRPQVEKLLRDPRCPDCGFYIYAESPYDARRALEVIDKILKEAK